MLDLLGTGGMGCVYRAEHRAMRRSVALKVIAQHKLGNPEMVRRFEREVRAAARLDHPNIVTAFDAGDVDGTHYLAMQCVDGRTLAAIGRRTRSSPASPPPPFAVAPFDAEQARAHQKAWATFLGIDVERTNSVGMTLLLIPPGQFSTRLGKAMIDETIAAPFFLGRTEVTQAQWRSVMDEEPWRGVPYTIAGDDIAVTSVSWDDVMAFCVPLTEQEQASGRIDTSQHDRLPTEAEWEHACRAGTLTPFSCGADVSLLEAYAWFGNTWDEDRRPRPGGSIGEALHAHAVGVKRPNPFGLHDVHGNVWEWCADWRSDYPTDGAGLPEIPDGSPFQAYRGGSWLNDAGGCRSVTRYGGHPAYQNNCIGFRVALSRREDRADSELAHAGTQVR